MTELMPSLCNDCVARNQCGKDDVKMCISYTKEIKIKCDDCKFVEDCVDYGWDGCKKFTQKASEPQTNEEWLKMMTTEQLAEWIAKIVDCDCCPVKRKFCDDNPCKIRFAEWLKQPHTNKE